MRFLKNVLLGICIELYQFIYLDIPDLEWRIIEQTDMRFIKIEISATNTDTIFSEIEIAYFSNLAHAWLKPHLMKPHLMKHHLTKFHSTKRRSTKSHSTFKHETLPLLLARFEPST